MYAIYCPYISKSFNNTYDKDIIIFRVTEVLATSNRRGYYALSNPLKLVKNKWKAVYKSVDPYYGTRVYLPKDMTTIPLCNDILLFPSFNHAYVAKLYKRNEHVTGTNLLPKAAQVCSSQG